MEKVYVIGHKIPDTDSIASAISYAEYKNSFDGKRRYIPSRGGELNPETTFVLNYFNVPTPLLLQTVEPTVDDLALKEPFYARPDTPVYDVATLMEEKNIKNVPVVDENGKIVGVVTERGLARVYVRRTRVEPLHIHPVPIRSLARILQAEILYKPQKQELISGSIHIAVDALHVLLKKIVQGDAVIVGDDEPAQIALLENGAKLLIVVNKAPVSKRVLEIAKQKGATILRTSADAFGAAKLINLSLPVSLIMSKDFPVVSYSTSLEDVKELVFESKYRATFVIDLEGRLVSIITRTDLMRTVRKKVILVDHNERSQAVDGVDKADILEIIDHHRIGDISTLHPVFFYNEPVGSTSTIIASWFFREGIKMEKEIAGLLLSGIISDTLLFALSTTTSKDKEIARKLEKISKVNIEDYGKKMLVEGMRIKGHDPISLLKRDVKEYVIMDHSIVISQIMTTDFEGVLKERDKFKDAMERVKGSLGADMMFVLFTDPIRKSSLVMYDCDPRILEHAFGNKGEENILELKNVMSRKKDFVPRIGDALTSLRK